MADPVLLARLEAAARRAFAGQGVGFAYLYGSRARGDFRADSDVDVAVQLDARTPPESYLDRRLELWQRLAGELAEELRGGGPADGEVDGEVDLVVLNEAPLPLRGRVVRDRVVLFSADEAGRVDFESLTAREFGDFHPFAEELAVAYLHDVAAGRR